MNRTPCSLSPSQCYKVTGVWAWNHSRSPDIALMLFVLLKNSCPPATEATRDKRVAFHWRSFHSEGNSGLLSSPGRCALGLALIFLFGHIEWKSFLKCGNSFLHRP